MVLGVHVWEGDAEGVDPGGVGTDDGVREEEGKDDE